MSREALEIAQQLVAVVARTFYEDDYVVALDYLNRHEIARYDVLAKHLHKQIPDTFKIYKDLNKQRLVEQQMRRDEVVESKSSARNPRRGQKAYFYIDYRQFVDVVKYRIWALQEKVKEKMQKEQDNLGYDCQSCSKHFTTMDVLPLVDMADGMFKCDYCGNVLIDNTESELAQKSQKELSRFMEQYRTIIELLQKTESIVLPAPTPLSEVPVPDTSSAAGDGGAGRRNNEAGPELNVSRDTGLTSGNTVIEFGPDLSPIEAARLREKELAKKMRQNQLPAWHIWSTVSGVQMVEDQKITPEAATRHARYIEMHNVRVWEWNKPKKERAEAAVKLLDKKLRLLANGQGISDGLQEEQVEAKREAYYQEFYNAIADRAGVNMPSDPREHYQKLIDQIASDEQAEKAERERRIQEMERLEKERKEAAARAAAENADRGYGASRSRIRYSQNPNRPWRSGYRHTRKMMHRLFEFVDGEQTESTDVPTETSADATGDGDATGNGEGASNVNANSNERFNNGNDVPDPYVEGIYGLSRQKRRRLGLDDAVVADIGDGDPESTSGESQDDSISRVDVIVCGKPKPIMQVTPEDEGAMSLSEYTEYWHAWRELQ
ncbi:hypothetical protein GGI15_002820 [Coemansia interrupta]|uniref:Transcription initiation factor IIE subunit alpha N-terminal domain-containing protein n=1 Tax=Coemansia interrupta TaxID=1126814 RepID=A0A9W8HBU1_9FUNG|nr:hypothetical protein GGI15_002820 [Coemansia interrupta]